MLALAGKRLQHWKLVVLFPTEHWAQVLLIRFGGLQSATASSSTSQTAQVRARLTSGWAGAVTVRESIAEIKITELVTRAPIWLQRKCDYLTLTSVLNLGRLHCHYRRSPMIPPIHSSSEESVAFLALQWKRRATSSSSANTSSEQKPPNQPQKNSSAHNLSS